MAGIQPKPDRYSSILGSFAWYDTRAGRRACGDHSTPPTSREGIVGRLLELGRIGNQMAKYGSVALHDTSLAVKQVIGPYSGGLTFSPKQQEFEKRCWKNRPTIWGVVAWVSSRTRESRRGGATCDEILTWFDEARSISDVIGWLYSVSLLGEKVQYFTNAWNRTDILPTQILICPPTTATRQKYYFTPALLARSRLALSFS